jgi:hypothetical protein
VRVLTINSHESYVYSLAQLGGIELDIIDRMPGRYTDRWDERIRPIPESARLITIDEALGQPERYDCFIGHNLTDISDTKELRIPSILVIHSSLDGLLATQTTSHSREEIHRILQKYMQVKNLTVVGVSRMKLNSWGVTDGLVIPRVIDTDFFQGWQGDDPRGLRVANQLVEKGRILALDFFTDLVRGFDIRLVGHNPQMGIKPARDQQELLACYQSHRYYIHTSSEGLEDGYNMASLEAMATGMPVVCNRHSTSPIIDGKNGFISDDIAYLQDKMHLLERDRELARQLGESTRQYVAANHTREQFDHLWGEVLETAGRRFAGS